MATFEDFILKLMTDSAFANTFLSPTSASATRQSALAAMKYSQAAINAAEAVFSSPNFVANMKTLMTQMTLADGGATLRN